ncbi:MAG: CHASE2 domain-containing protein [Elainella sp. Prado103]|jgi:CHASE2 domain-containing sensor protein|nr:CHASE2 domain-containing protein [Elainella sp. Prado103]
MLDSLLKERYKLVSLLGTGGFGQTYLAIDRVNHDQNCVVKQLKPAKTDDQFLLIARRLFDTEVKALVQLGQHPQIPSFLDFFEEAGEFYLVQELIDGHPLTQEFLPDRRLSEAGAIDLLQDVLGILTFVHAQQVIHRDIKPSNLLRRHTDGRIVLIDFGAVKEIGTQLFSEAEQKFTVGIGTQGYTPSEQLAGRPRYCSDLYALGVTVIQAITGIGPTQLPVDPDTGELVWHTHAAVGLGFKRVLDNMVRYHFSQRYQSAQEVLQALDHLHDHTLESTILPSALVVPPSLLHHPIGDQSLVDSPVDPPQAAEPPQRLRVHQRRRLWQIGCIVVAVTGLLTAARQVGWLQAPELALYDQLTRLQPDRGVDPRLLVVEITEADLQALQRGTPSDQDVAQVIRTLQQHQPRVIGLDLHRDLPQEPGHQALLQQLQAENVVAIMKLGNEQQVFDIPPPKGVPPERLGFNDFPIDPDGVVRRNLLYGTLAEQTFMSFGLRLATKYLAADQIKPLESESYPGVMQLDQTIFMPLEQNSGGYQRVDAAGYQILLNYRSPRQPAQQVSFLEVLQNRIAPDQVKDKVVLIGTTAPSGKDLFYTPFSSGSRGQYLMPGVVIHAQMVSQVLSAVLDQQPLRWWWADHLEWLWMSGWVLMGGGLVWFVRHPIGLSLGTIGLLVGLGATVWIVFANQGWLPGVTPAIGLVLTEAIVLVCLPRFPISEK